VWVCATLAGQIRLLLARRGGALAHELRVRRGLEAVVWLEHVALAVALLTGAALMRANGWSVGHPRWLGIKLGLVVFLVLPLESMHAYVNHVWIARGLRQTEAPPFSKDLVRGIGMDDMIRTLALVLLGAALPLMLWLSVAKPLA
jgi:hypothetical protein